MPKGHYKHKPLGQRVTRVIVTCEQCGEQREFLPGFLRLHPSRFCSRKCAGLAARKPDALVEVKCGCCGAVFKKRRDHLKARNYCSRECTVKSRTKVDAKWRDPVQIKKYMQHFRERNRASLNAKSRERVSRNRERRRAVQARYRQKNKAAIKRLTAIRRAAVRSGVPATVEQVERLFKRAHGRCVYCGRLRVLTLDHVTPLTANGTNERTNLIPACKPCNSSKNNRDAVEWVYQSFGVEGLARALMFLEGKRVPPALFGNAAT